MISCLLSFSSSCLFLAFFGGILVRSTASCQSRLCSPVLSCPPLIRLIIKSLSISGAWENLRRQQTNDIAIDEATSVGDRNRFRHCLFVCSPSESGAHVDIHALGGKVTNAELLLVRNPKAENEKSM